MRSIVVYLESPRRRRRKNDRELLWKVIIAVYLKSPRRRQATKFMSKTVVKSFQPIKKPLQFIETHVKLTWNQFKTHSKLPKTHSKSLKTQWKYLTIIKKQIFILFENPFSKNHFLGTFFKFCLGKINWEFFFPAGEKKHRKPVISLRKSKKP